MFLCRQSVLVGIAEVKSNLDDRYLANVLLVVTTKMPVDLFPKVFRIVSQMSRYGDKVLIAMMERIPEYMVPQVFEIFESRREPYAPKDKPQLLKKLTEKFPQQVFSLLEERVAVEHQLKNVYSMADNDFCVLLEALIPKLSSANLLQAFQMLQLIRRRNNDKDYVANWEVKPDSVLDTLAARLSELPYHEIRSFWIPSLHEASKQERSDLFLAIASLTPLITSIDGCLEEVVREVQTVKRWYP